MRDPRFTKQAFEERERPKFTCPRCRAPAPRLTKCYWHPPEHPGLCPPCSRLAERHFEANEWPAMPEEPWWVSDPDGVVSQGAREAAWLPSERRRHQTD